MTLRNILLGATMLCAATPAFAFAQEAPADDAAAAASGTTDYGNDIIVTASKRSQTLQDTPIAVSVTSAADIQNAQIRDLIDLQSAVPSLRVSRERLIPHSEVNLVHVLERHHVEVRRAHDRPQAIDDHQLLVSH